MLLTDLIPFSRIYRMETEFAAGVTEILTRLGLPEAWAAERLEHPQNASRKLKEPVFDEQLAERVYQCFAPDFDEFGYDRESWHGLSNPKDDPMSIGISKHASLSESLRAAARSPNTNCWVG